MPDTRAPEIITFGCRLNAYESEVMRKHADKAGLTNTVIINTCAVTSEAERQARQAIRRARRKNPEARIVVTGCAAQINPADYAAMAEVDVVLGNTEKLDPARFTDLDHAPVQVNDIMSARETAAHLIEGFDGRARAFIQVQNGCDHRCTFCIIPFGRGNSRSVPIGTIVEQVRTLVDHGVQEVVLSGVDMTSYGADLPGRPRAGQMIRRLLANVPDLPRLRLSSIDVAEIDDDLLHLIADEPRLMPHLHLSLQAGDDMILKRMKRRHSRAQAIAFCEQARRLRPDIVFGADLIAGFPTETDAMFAQSEALVAECGLTHLHVFPYSPRPETPAARMPQLDRSLIKKRAADLRAAGDRNLAAFLRDEVGQTRAVLLERPGMGRTEQFAEVVFEDTNAAPGQIIDTRITGADGTRLNGVTLRDAA
ncbi:MAG: tRNA (N(6)-L-threonylcarbamoyladenosine(37)-C(2))-methylthiotransferase MtaB [Rhodospirillaceae bacterium]|jgi:threonylcarbamoyladenosine tRNA methylthiotransferase MtaB|nr:tRNA (N(6)-L-threonylcarbamoyladenosine(37)-C(2))-methylthiotransferase MtaB [Rhodospirillaceae bacterium]MBT3930246.1 tRNA (N(6)-L-threonylcarbamoyladenosine(37)-C(2))-methylthiotransferase MtaB [Rhodospirillaceae bacterium]MBT4773327.1 tRNA (N(6)-L-threonylcarbamoyladenosine(37)-C(2))-methylthiotransferase MtaB [Rhodospirillaceae bacterium]MBT5769958.1 tRNA (N(6)-L-threonylcarbamoyladenosine(37)-C(2))-methylthiotransferase MtaB [Rhodospirillaceae bacterium]MBT6309893.1 tRNA (N(6)-L-threony